jgi:hypothetical protein
MLGMSAVPNHAARTESGFAATTAAPASRSASGPGKSRTMDAAASVASSTSTR